MFLGKDGEHCSERGKVQCQHLLVELFRQEVDNNSESEVNTLD